MVPSVAKIPIFLEIVIAIAGFIPGSMQIIGKLKFSLNLFEAHAVAVLQAITAPWIKYFLLSSKKIA